MSIEAISWAFKQELPPRDKFVLIALCDHYNRDEKRAWMKQETLAKLTGYTRPTVNAALQALEDVHGLITSETRRYDDGRNAAKIYRINFDANARVKRVDPGRVKEIDSGPARVKGVYSDRVNAVDSDRVNHVDSKIHELRTVNLEPLPPQPLHEPAATEAAAAAAERDQEDKADLEDLTPYQRRQATRPPDTLAASRLATYHQQAWNALIDFRRMHGEVRDAQFNAWARAVAEDVDAHGERVVAAALTVTIENFPTLKTPFSFYRACVRRAATGTPGRDDDLSAPAVMSQDDLDRLFALAKEGALA